MNSVIYSHIEFSLPSDLVAAVWMSRRIRNRLYSLQEEKLIGEFTIHVESPFHHKIKIDFLDEKDFTVFFLIWNNEGISEKPKLIKRNITNE